jgi:hypothetical protein
MVLTPVGVACFFWTLACVSLYLAIHYTKVGLSCLDELQVVAATAPAIVVEIVKGPSIISISEITPDGPRRELYDLTTHSREFVDGTFSMLENEDPSKIYHCDRESFDKIVNIASGLP